MISPPLLRWRGSPLLHRSGGRAIGWLLAIFLAAISGAEAAPVPRSAGRDAASSRPPHPRTVLLPERAGWIDEIYVSPDFTDSWRQLDREARRTHRPPRLLVFIENPHTSVSSQRAIAKLLNHFEASHNLPLVALEGGEGLLDTLPFQAFPKRQAWARTALALLEAGELSGSEFNGVTHAGAARYVGIENQPLYEDNRRAFVDAVAARRRHLPALALYHRTIWKLKRETYPPDFFSFERSSFVTGRGAQDLAEWVRVLTARHRSHGHSSLEGRYPQLVRFARALQDTPRKNGHNGSLSPHAVPALDLKALRSEIRLLEAEIEQTFDRSQGVRRLAELGRQFEDLTSVLLLEASAGEAMRAAGHEARDPSAVFWDLFGEMTKGRVRVGQRKQVGKLLHSEEPALRFYRLALDRDVLLFSNFERLAGETETTFMAAVVGDFHRDSFLEQARRNGWSYLAITPTGRQEGGLSLARMMKPFARTAAVPRTPVFTLAPPLALAAGNPREHASFLEYAFRRLLAEEPLNSSEFDAWETQLYLFDRASGLIDTPLRRLHVELMEPFRGLLDPAPSAMEERSRRFRFAERELAELSQEATDETARRLSAVRAGAGTLFRALQLLAKGVYPPSHERELRASTIQCLSLRQSLGELEGLMARLAAYEKWSGEGPRWVSKIEAGISSTGMDASERLARSAFGVAHAFKRLLWMGLDRDAEAALEYFVAGPVRVEIGPKAAEASSQIEEHMLDELIRFADSHAEDEFVKLTRSLSEERLETLSPNAVLQLVLNEDLAWQEREQTLALLLGAGNSYLPALKDRSKGLAGFKDEGPPA